MAKVMQLDLHRLLADLLERLEQIVESTHQQNSGDEKTYQKPARQFAHTAPQLVIGLPGVTNNLQFSQLQPARGQNRFVGYFRKQAQINEPLRHPLNIVGIFLLNNILGSQQVQTDQAIISPIKYRLDDGFSPHLVTIFQIRCQRQSQGCGGVDDCGFLLLRQIGTSRVELHPIGGCKQQPEQDQHGGQ